MSIELPARPQKGQKIPHDYFQRMWDHQKSLELRGDLSTTTVKRDRSGTVVHSHSRGGNASPRIETIIAQIDVDNNDGTYDATEQKNASGTFSDRTSTTGMVFDSGNNGNLYELNGLRGVPVDTFVVVHRIADTSGGPIWYFDGQQDAYGVDGSGAWVKITANTSSPYSWTQLDPDASTTTSPAVTGTSDLYEVNGYDGYLKDMVVWAVKDGTNYQFSHHHDSFWAEITGESAGSYSWTEKQSNASTSTTRTGSTNATEVNAREGIPTGSIVRMFQGSGPGNYRFEFHGADVGTLDTLNSGTGTSANTDTWERDNQGATRGEEHDFVARLIADGSTGELVGFSRTQEHDANGHEENISAETKEILGVFETSADTYEYVDCATGLVTVARFALADLPTDDYCWIHDGTSFVKAYNDGLSAGAATSPVPCVIYMPTTPANCAAVQLDAWDDDLSSVDFTCKWLDSSTGSGTASQVSGGVRIQTTSTSEVAGFDSADIDSDVTGIVKFECDYSNFTLNSGDNLWVYFALRYSDATKDEFGVNEDGDLILYKATGGNTTGSGTFASSGTVSIERTGSLIKGTAFGSSLSYSAHSKELLGFRVILSTSTAYGYIDIDDIKVTD